MSINLFNLLCDGFGNYSRSSYSTILKFGGPVLYMILQGITAFGVLVYVDSGAPFPSCRSQSGDTARKYDAPQDVVDEERRIGGQGDLLSVSHLRKKYRSAEDVAVNDISFGVQQGETFALIGPNGAGKTTTLACIRGAVSFLAVGERACS